jgi:hypothetical protein
MEEMMNPTTKTSRIARTISPALAFVVLMLAAAHWTQFSRQADAASGGAVSQVSAERFEYFPDGYVNQAQHIEEHIQAF